VAFADYDIGYSFYNASYMENAPNGTARLNASVTPNPLTTTGAYCREFRHVVTAAAFTRASEFKAEISAAVAGGNFVNTPSTVALSLRARVRMNFQSGTYSNTITNPLVSLFAFAPPIGTDANFGGGYELALQQDTSTTVRLAIRASTGGLSRATGAAAQAASAHRVTCSGSYTFNTWYHIRMDVVPNGTSQKTITAFTSADEGVTWDQVGSYTVTSADSGIWSSTGRCGFSSYLATSSSSAITHRHYVDDFQAYSVAV